MGAGSSDCTYFLALRRSRSISRVRCTSLRLRRSYLRACAPIRMMLPSRSVVVDARDPCVRKHHRGLLGVTTHRERGAIQLDPFPWLTAFYDHEVVADVVGGASHREQGAGGKNRSFEFVVCGRHVAPEG